MEVICGTYEELVIGFKLKGHEFDVSFTDHSHTGNVKSVAVSERGFLATGSSDETIHLFNLETRKELGSLMHHEGSISSLKFHGKAHMFSACEDGTIVIWKVGSWESLRTLRGHKEAVYDMSIHPSGKMALSVSKDKTMRTWNLINGKCAYVTKIKAVADHVYWMPNGDRYIVCADRTIDVYGVETGKVEHTMNLPGRVNALTFIEDGTMVLGGEGGIVYLYNTEDYTMQYEFSTETVRIKGLHCCECPDQGSVWLVTGSADGKVKLWKLKSIQGKWNHSEEASTDCKFRITSMAVRMERKSQAKEDSSEKKRKKISKKDITSKKKKVEVQLDEENVEEDSEDDTVLLKKKDNSAHEEISDYDEDSADDNDICGEGDMNENLMVTEDGQDSSDEEDSEEDVVIPKKSKMSNGKTQKKKPLPQSTAKKQVHQSKSKSSKQKKKNKKY